MQHFLTLVPSIVYPLIDAMAVARMARLVHCNLHAHNVILDFIQDHCLRVGIIDWGLMLKGGEIR